MKTPAKKYKVDINRVHMYRAYHKTVGKDNALSPSVHSKVLNAFNKRVSELIMNEAYDFHIPFNLGVLKIKKYKQKVKFDNEGNLIKGKLNPNWKATMELWDKNPKAKAEKKLIYYTNEHSEGYEYRWLFDNSRNKCVNKSAYYFIPSRTNKRTLAALIKDENFKGDFYM